jgi:hypothetical protein
MKKIVLSIDPDAMPAFREFLPDFERQLSRSYPSAKVGHVASSAGRKDAVAVITAASTLLAVATPTIIALFAGRFTRLGYDVVLDAAQGKLSITRSKGAPKTGKRPRSRAAKKGEVNQ